MTDHRSEIGERRHAGDGLLSSNAVVGRADPREATDKAGSRVPGDVPPAPAEGVARLVSERSSSAGFVPLQAEVVAETRSLQSVTKAVPVEGSVEHEGCVYFAAVFLIEGCGRFWFCNKCGQGGEVFP